MNTKNKDVSLEKTKPLDFEMSKQETMKGLDSTKGLCNDLSGKATNNANDFHKILSGRIFALSSGGLVFVGTMLVASVNTSFNLISLLQFSMCGFSVAFLCCLLSALFDYESFYDLSSRLSKVEDKSGSVFRALKKN